jgi:hypothetical protein
LFTAFGEETGVERDLRGVDDNPSDIFERKTKLFRFDTVAKINAE